jgi:hypothetical protein
MDVKQILYEFTGEAKQLEATLETIRGEIKSLPNKKKIEITAEQTQALVQITNLRTLIEGIRDEEVDIKVQAKLSDLLSDIAKVEALISAIPDQKNVTINIKQNVDTAVARITSRLRGMESDIGKIGKDGPSVFKRLESAGGGLSGVFGQLSTGIRRLPPLLQGMVLIIVTALIPAILALGEAAAGAVAGLVALGTALVAALGPSVALLVALFARFAAVLKARQAEQQALAAETKKSAQATLQQAQADERARDAADAVTKASQQVVTARQAYRQAVQDTRDAIVKANQDETEALRAVAQAHQDLREATVAAYGEMRRAALDAADAVIQVREAELGVERGKLNIRKAALELRKFRREAGLGAGSLDALFKRATDVTIDPNQARKAIGQIIKSGDELGEEQAIRLRELILNLKDAKLQEKQATQGVKRATLDESDARRKAADFAQRGIQASDSYRGAVERLRSSQKTANDAIKEANRLNAEGIQNSPRVIAAARSVADAEEAVAGAIRNQRLNRLEQKAALEQQTAQTNTYRDARKKLTKTEREFLDLIDEISKHLRGVLGPATDEVFQGIIDATKTIGPAFAATEGFFRELGSAWGDLITQFAQNLVRPDNLIKLQGFFQAAIPLVAIFSSLLTSVSDIFINIATAAMPLLLGLLAQFAAWLDGLASKTGNITAINDALVPMIQVIKDFLSTVVAIGAGILNIFLAAQEPITQFTAAIAEAANAFLAWTQSAHGRTQIRQFFERTLPEAQAFLTTIVLIASSFLRLMEAAAPVLNLIFHMTALIFRHISNIAAGVADVIDWFVRLADTVTGGRFSRIAGFLARAFVNPIGTAIDYVKWLIDKLKDLIAWLGKIHFPSAPAWFKKALGAVGGAIGGVLPGGAKGGIANSPTAGVWGEAGPEALLPLTQRVLGALGRAIVSATSGVMPAMSGRVPAIGGAGGAGQTIINHNHFHIPHPLDSSRAIDPENTAALLQQAWERRGGGWH